MSGTTSTALPSFSHDQHHKTDAAKWKKEGKYDNQHSTTYSRILHATIYNEYVKENPRIN